MESGTAHRPSRGSGAQANRGISSPTKAWEGSKALIFRQDIERLTGRGAFVKAEKLEKDGAVLGLSRADTIVTARVKGSAKQPYDVRIVLKSEPTGTTFSGRCTCPMQVNCKHVGATLLAFRRTGGVMGAAEPRNAAPETHAGLSTSNSLSLQPAQLGPMAAGWLRDLTRRERPEDYPPDVAHRLIYVLGPSTADRTGNPPISVVLKTMRLAKSGRLTEQPGELEAWKISATNAPKYLRGSDIAIVTAIATKAASYGVRQYDLHGPRLGWVLPKILDTGRARWGSSDGPAMTRGPTRKGRFSWRRLEGGNLRLEVVLDADPSDAQEPAMVLTARPPVWVKPMQGLIGNIDTGVPEALMHTLVETPQLKPFEIEPVAQAMFKAGGVLAELAPKVWGASRVLEVDPIPVLEFSSTSLEVYSPGSWRRVWTTASCVILSFLYGGQDVSAGEPAETLLRTVGEELVEIRRNRRTERKLQAPLKAAQLTTVSTGQARTGLAFVFDDERNWLPFMTQLLPELQAQGYRVRMTEAFLHQIVVPERDVEVSVDETPGGGWFDLAIEIEADGGRIDLVGAIESLVAQVAPDDLMRTLDRDDVANLYLKVAPNKYLAIEATRLRPYIGFLIDLLGTAPLRSGKKVRLNRADAAALGSLGEAGSMPGIWTGGERLLALARQLGALGSIPETTIPSSFKASLRPYQARGVAWLTALKAAGLGAVLADDMGLGKTLQALALVAVEKAAGRLGGPVLVVAPTSLMANWHREAARFTPDLKVVILQGLDRSTRFGEIDAADIVLTTYTLVTRDQDVLAARTWPILILDEAQAVKNPAAATTKLIRSMAADHRVILTGTPLENNLAELWCLFDIAIPSYLGDLKSFTTRYRTPIEKKGDTRLRQTLARRVKPFMLRRTKDEVARDLPSKTEIVERVELDTDQRTLYESIRLAMKERIRTVLAEKGFARSRIEVLDALLKLRQACCDPRLVKKASGRVGTGGSAKLERLVEMVRELVNEGRRVLVFSQFTSMLDLVMPRLEAERIPFSLLTGDTRDRPAAIAAFQDGRVPVFLLSLKAGGVGLNLTAADTVILYDPWWNPAVERQAIDRAHRIGQDKPVFVYRLMAADTIEEKIEDLKARKAALAEAMFDSDGAPTTEMTETDLMALLG